MQLAQKFLEATTCRSVSVGSLEVERKYSTNDNQRLAISHAGSVLPKRYGAVITDADLEIINSWEHPLKMIFKGKCINTNSYMLAFEA
jgi:hypothetical protein